MSNVLRPDFATAGASLVGNAQRKNFAHLHDWLMNEVGLLPGETVQAVTNYQQGSFGSLPNHVLLVTNKRIAYTHDGGMKSTPLSSIDPTRIGLKTGIVNGELTLVTKDGEQLRFKKGVSLAMQEVAQYIMQDTQARAPQPVAAPPAGRTAPVAKAPPAPTPAPTGDGLDDIDWVSGVGDGLVKATADGIAPVRIEIVTDDHSAVWELKADGNQGDLLVNKIGSYSGTRLVGTGGPLGGIQITTPGRWRVGFVDWKNVRRWKGSVTGSGDDVLALPTPTAGLVTATLVHSGTDNFSVWSYGQSRDLLANTIGAYRGTVRVPPGTQFIAINADGPWQAVLA